MVLGGITDKHVLESLLLGGSGNKGWGSKGIGRGLCYRHQHATEDRYPERPQFLFSL
jgi:hypothetical protein